MAKKIRFPLKLADNAQVRTLDELREHFDLEAIVGYFKSGKLLTWLEDRYLEGEAEAVRALDEAAPDFQEKLCELFQVEYTGNAVDLEAVARRQERLAKLRTVTDEQEFIDHIDQVAFDQEDLADLLDEGTNTIYLCGEKFVVPASRKGIYYVGVNHPAVHISGTLPKRREELGIEFRAVECDNLPDSVVEALVHHVELEYSNTGYRTPQVYFNKPVYLDGMKYDHVPVLSAEIFENMNLTEGCKVEVYWVSDAIPAIKKIANSDGPLLILPQKCPSCGNILEICNKNLYCSNINCAANIHSKIKRFIQGIGIEGYDDDFIERIIAGVGIATFPIHKLCCSTDDMFREWGLQTTSDWNFVNELRKRVSEIPVYVYVGALIPGISILAAKKLLIEANRRGEYPHDIFTDWLCDEPSCCSYHEIPDVIKRIPETERAVARTELCLALCTSSISGGKPLIHPERWKLTKCDLSYTVSYTGKSLFILDRCKAIGANVTDGEVFDILITVDKNIVARYSGQRK